MNSFLNNVSNILFIKKKLFNINALFLTFIINKNSMNFNIFFSDINTTIKVTFTEI